MRAVAVLSLALASAGAAADCPYKVFAWITHDDSNPSYYTSFDWTCIGSVGFFGDLETITGLRDYAHERGVKLSRFRGNSLYLVCFHMLQGTSMSGDMTNARFEQNTLTKKLLQR